MIYDFAAKKPLSQKVLPKSTLAMVDRVMGAIGIGIEMHSADSVFVPSRSRASDLHESYESMPAQFISAAEAAKNDINKIIYFLENEEQAKTVFEISKEYENECVFYPTGTTINGEKQNYCEQIPRGVSKASALDELKGLLGIGKGGYFAIGDYYNDLEMINAADISAVPADSPDDIKRAATFVAGSAKNGAVADFIEYLEERFKNGR